MNADRYFVLAKIFGAKRSDPSEIDDFADLDLAGKATVARELLEQFLDLEPSRRSNSRALFMDLRDIIAGSHQGKRTSGSGPGEIAFRKVWINVDALQGVRAEFQRSADLGLKDVNQFADDLAAAFLCQPMFKTALGSRFSEYAASLVSEMKDFERYRTAELKPGGELHNISQLDFTSLQTRLAEIGAAIEQLTKREQALTAATEKNSELFERLEANARTANEKLAAVPLAIAQAEEFLSTVPENLAAFRRAAFEALRIDSTRTLWKDRARTSEYAFRTSAVLLFLLLAVAPAFMIVHFDDVLLALRHIELPPGNDPGEGADPGYLTVVAVSRLVLVSIPVALYFWLIRLLVRFNLRSLVLMDDARQRHTLLDTYFQLIERDSASKEDRAVVLAALFRPLPGHGDDNVDPPNFTELLSKGMGK
ncbi:MAG TPA: DUF6161 domain-containing protein [Ensifer sp.]|uniref:DUF6161 domain-containing protein n=1 Tax=Ensifer sp. TaxID=1872086 RepID=UPI002E111510|nr:DUF6161 domain-containing protein [Ensifer sp.]